MSVIKSRRNSLEGITFAHIKQQAPHADLWFDTYLPKQERKSDEARSPEVEQEKKVGVRTAHMQELCDLEVPELYHEWYKCWETTLQLCGAKTRHAEATSRISVGLGEESVLETSVALHHTYGVPYIAGSALKGLVASYIRQKLLPLDPVDDNAKQWKQAHTIICGDQDNAGYLTFFDALYIPQSGEQPLVPDVITIHHQKYYQGANDAPADWDSPIPVPFPSARGHYLIALAAPDLLQGTFWINTTFAILEAALKTLGIGAKTSSGYGRMKYVSPFSKEAQQIIDEIEQMTYLEINPTIHRFYERWNKLQNSKDRLGVAEAIIEKVRTNKYETRKIKLPWYQELLKFVEQANTCI